MISRLRFLRTVWRLGPAAVADVAAYRLACRSGCYRYFMPVQRWNGGGEFFTPSPAPSPELPQKSRRALLERANALLDGELEFYSNVRKRVGSPPDWFLDSFSGSRLAAEGHWSTIDEFSSGDVKNVWEASRLEWVP